MAGHKIAHELEHTLLQDKSLQIIDVIIHVEPYLPEKQSQN
jgi:divalent metal cation (Fe/Co/Zn/Cd) transporter